ncbi:MAG: TlyA family RNA methyltransferase, partial [Eubacterium sp.]
MSKKIRLDVAVFEKGFAPSREKAKAVIMAGLVYVNNQKVDKAGTEIKEDDVLEVRGSTLKYVSRGGLKLEKAMQAFPINLNGKICMDVGASTGGFTDCMLMNGAVRVYSVDVGYGQLAWKLRCDSRVVNLERTNFRYVTEEQIKDKIDFSSVDVSFISLKHILPNLYHLLADDGQAVCLIKPQFEAGRDKVGKKGVVRDKAVRLEVVSHVIDMALKNGFSVKGLQFSP